MNVKKEKYIDPEGMINYLFNNIKVLIIFLIIGGIMGIGTCFITNKMVINQKRTDEEKEEKIEDARLTLSNSRIKDVDSIYASYKSLITQRDYLRNYLSNSVYLNLDSKYARKNTIIYSVSGTAKMNAIVSSFKQSFKNKKLYDAINKSLGKSLNAAYLSELIYIGDDSGNPSGSSSIIMDKNVGRSFYITIYGENEGQCKKISKCIKSEATQYVKQLKQSFGNFEINLSNDSYGEVTSTEISDAKLSFDNKLSSITSTISNITAGLSDDQINYLNALIDNSPSSSNNEVREKINIKGIAIYFLVGAVSLILIYLIIKILIYIFDGKIHTEKEFDQYYGINVFENCNPNENNVHVVSEDIYYMYKKNQLNSIGLLSSNENNIFMEQVYNYLKDNLHIDCKLMKAFPITHEDFTDLANINGIIMFEELNKIHYNKINKILRHYDDKNIKVLGAVLLDS